MAGTVLRALSGCRGLAINWLIVGIFAFSTFSLGMLRERMFPGAPRSIFRRTSPLSASYRAYRPGIAVRASMAHVTSRVFPTRKTKSLHPPNCGRALFRSDGRVAVKHRGRSLSKSDRCCQRQRLSFIRRGVVPNHLSRKRSTLKGLIGRPFRASKAHRLPKSVGYVSAWPRQVKQKWLKNRAFGPFGRRIPYVRKLAIAKLHRFP